MSDKSSPESYSDRVAGEMQRLVRRAAEPVNPGASIKSQIRTAYERLGRPDFWRVREAWYGDAGKWSAAVVEEFRDRFSAHRNREIRRGRTLAAEQINTYRQTVEALRAIDPHFHRHTIAALERTIDAARLPDRPMAEADD